MKRSEWSDFHMSGDIIFTYAGGRRSFGNLCLQTISARRRARYSHVILCVAPGLYIHSDMPAGVSLVSAEDFSVSRKYRKFKVLRNPAIESDPSLKASLQKFASYHLLKRYNSAFQASRYSQRISRGHVFCSELIARIFQDMKMADGLPVHPTSCLPVHIERWVCQTGWRDITDQYWAADQCHAQGNMAGDSLERDLYLSFHNFMIKSSLQQIEAMKEMGGLFSLMDRLINEVVDGKKTLDDNDVKSISDYLGIKSQDPMISLIENHLIKIDGKEAKSEDVHGVTPGDDKNYWFQLSVNDINKYFSKYDQKNEEINSELEKNIIDIYVNNNKLMREIIKTITVISMGRCGKIESDFNIEDVELGKKTIEEVLLWINKNLLDPSSKENFDEIIIKLKKHNENGRSNVVSFYMHRYLLLRCFLSLDFVREFLERLREGKVLESDVSVMEKFKKLSEALGTEFLPADAEA